MRQNFKGLLIMILWLAELISSLTLGAWASELKQDEYVQLYPVVANLNDKGEWEATLIAWVHESEQRPGAKKLLARWLDIDLDKLTEAETEVYEARTQLFRFDSERNKKITLQIAGDKKVVLPLTNAQGISKKKLIYKNTLPLESQQVAWLDVKVLLPESDTREFRGQLMLVPRQGLSVISDVDDTIKASNVLDKKELLLNTFVRPFVAAEGMAQLYQKLASQNPGASFHYVSSSPHQLYPALDSFLQENAFPPGSLHLRHIKLTEEVLRKGSSSARHKHQAIRGLLQHFPARQFVLVGDSGEADPEIYAAIAEDYPQQVKAIFIRDVTGEAATASRYQKAFGKLGSMPWYVFTSADSLPVDFGTVN